MGVKCIFFETFLSKLLHGWIICITFASAFENEQNLKLNEIKKRSRSKKKEFFEKIYINRQVVQEANMINFGFDYLSKIRTVNLYNKVKTSIKMEARSEQIQTNAALVIGQQ